MIFFSPFFKRLIKHLMFLFLQLMYQVLVRDFSYGCIVSSVFFFNRKQDLHLFLYIPAGKQRICSAMTNSTTACEISDSREFLGKKRHSITRLASLKIRTGKSQSVFSDAKGGIRAGLRQMILIRQDPESELLPRPTLLQPALSQ